jgi:hypothetical protein
MVVDTGVSVQYPVAATGQAAAQHSLLLPQAAGSTPGATGDGSDASATLGSIAVPNDGANGTTHCGTGHSTASGIAANVNLAGDRATVRQITLVLGHIDSLGIDDGIIPQPLAGCETDADQ